MYGKVPVTRVAGKINLAVNSERSRRVTLCFRPVSARERGISCRFRRISFRFCLCTFRKRRVSFCAGVISS